MKPTRTFGIALASTMHSAGLIIGGFVVERYLTEEFPIQYSWKKIVFSCVLIGVCHTYFIMFRALLRMEKKDRDGANKKDI